VAAASSVGGHEITVQIDSSLPARVDQDPVGQDDPLLGGVPGEHLPGHADGGLEPVFGSGQIGQGPCIELGNAAASFSRFSWTRTRLICPVSHSMTFPLSPARASREKQGPLWILVSMSSINIFHNVAI
jgi:hypothetical protein